MKLHNKYANAFSLGLQSAVEYRWNFLLGFISLIFTLTIQYFMWNGIYASSDQQTVYGYTYSEMIIYSVFASLVSKLVAGGFEYGIHDDIKNGGLSKFIIKPVRYLPYRLACFLGERSVYSLIFLALAVVFSCIFQAVFHFHASIAGYAFTALSIVMSILINFLIYSTLAALSFWMTDATGVFVICGLVINVVSGGIFPLDIFGKTLQRVFGFLPFQYTIYFPVNILEGKAGLSDILFGLSIQAFWIVIMLLILNLVWKSGLKKYVAVGG